jgi:hypothetical protein
VTGVIAELMQEQTGVIAELIQEQTGVFAEQMQGWHLYVLGYSVSIFSNSMSMLIVTLGLLGHSNRYRATVAMICNRPAQAQAGQLRHMQAGSGTAQCRGEGVRQSLPGLRKAHTVIPAVTQGQSETVCNSAYDSSSVHRDSGNT